MIKVCDCGDEKLITFPATQRVWIDNILISRDAVFRVTRWRVDAVDDVPALDDEEQGFICSNCGTHTKDFHDPEKRCAEFMEELKRRTRIARSEEATGERIHGRKTSPGVWSLWSSSPFSLDALPGHGLREGDEITARHTPKLRVFEVGTHYALAREVTS